MEKGDISNKLAPAIVIDIDDLIVEAPNTVAVRLGRRLGQKLKLAEAEVAMYKVNDKIYPLLERLFYQDVSVYLFAHRPPWYRKALEKKLEDLLYTRLYVGGIRERETLLKRRHVHWYFYHKPEHASILSKEKEWWVEKWNDISL